MTIVIAVLVFSLLIFVHELGHFAVAKWSGVRVNEFALGMGPKLFSIERGETRYSIRMFPIGGFCAMEGENEESSDGGAFCNARLSRRIAITMAGSVMNLVLGLILLGILSSQMSLLGTTVVAQFEEGSSSSAQLQVGDEIRKINGNRVRSNNDIVYEFTRAREGDMDMEVVRDGQTLQLRVPFRMEELEEGISMIDLDFRLLGVEPTVWGVVRNTFNWTISIVKQVWGGLVDLITGRYGANQLSGPVGVTSAIGQASSMGWKSLFLLVAFITVNLGVFNLLPVPALDGGRMLFLILEGIRRKPIDQKYEGLVHTVGFVLLIGLMLFVTFNDVVRLITK